MKTTDPELQALEKKLDKALREIDDLQRDMRQVLQHVRNIESRVR